VLREALRRMGRSDLIGNGKHHLIPAYQPVGSRPPAARALNARAPGARALGTGTAGSGAPARPFRTQHTGLPKSGGSSPRLKSRGKR
jgi:Domain of unknown function (DUF3362)